MRATNQSGLSFFNYIPVNKHQFYYNLWSHRAGMDITTPHELDNYLSYFRHERLEKPLFLIGAGTCGLGAGAQKTKEALQKELSQLNISALIEVVGCVGLCSEEPLIDVLLPGKNRLTFGKVMANRVPDLLRTLFDEGSLKTNLKPIFQWNEDKELWKDVPLKESHPFFHKQERVVLQHCGQINPLKIEEYLAYGGYQSLMKALHQHTPNELCDLVEQSGLRGRGGGGFLTGKKWKFALNTPSERHYFICNADEGDPGAFMDRAVIEGDPHRLLEGLIIASYAIKAHKAYIYIRAEYPLAIRHLEKAIKEAHQFGFLGDNILDSNFHLEVVIKKGAGAFVCGEETALIHSIEGKRGMPRLRPPFPAIKGLHHHPTIINNVETLANIPSIVGRGSEWFSSIGTEGSKGTKVFALSGKVQRTGLVEVPMGVSIRDIVFTIGGGIPRHKKYKAVQIGGPSGGCVPTQHLDIAVDYESLKTIGAMMGSGGLVVMDEDNCMVDVAKFFMDFIQRESCGKCIPCREGTKQLLAILETLTAGRHQEKGFDALERFQGILKLKELAQVIQETSLCGLGQSAPNPVLSTLRWFPEEYEDHIYRRHCKSGACGSLVNYSIDQEKCIGCTACVKQCPSKAIMGAVKSPHYIIEEKCIRCGQCLKVCRPKAVVRV